MKDYLAIILAAGMGTRLGKEDAFPKCMLEIDGQKLLDIQLDYLNQAGITEAVIIIGYKAQEVCEYFGLSYKDLDLTYVDTEEHSRTDVP